MSKHVSSGGEATSSSRDAATESLPTRDAADAAADAVQRLSQDVADGPGSDDTKDVKDLKDSAGSVDSGSARTEVLAKDVTQESATGSGAARSAAGSSTADTRLGGAWASPDAQNAAAIGVVPSTSAAAKKAWTKARGPWYRRRAVVGAAGVALLAGSFGAGWGANELLSSNSQHGQTQQQGGGNGQGMPAGGQGGPGGGGPGGQMPGGGPGGPGGPGGQNGQGGPGGGSGGAGRTTPNGDASSGSGSSNGDQKGGSGDGNQKGGSGSSGVLQQQDASPSTQG